MLTIGNDLQPWKYHQLPQVFGQGWSDEVQTEDELENALLQAKQNTDFPSFIEVHLDRLDCSRGLIRLGQAISSLNKTQNLWPIQPASANSQLY